MSSWNVRKPSRGEMVRVNRGKYYHYGICVAPEKIVHFASPDGDGFDSPSSAVVCGTTLPHFASGSFVECLELSREERKFAFTAEETAARAEAALGQSGYDVITNNCAHFANRCLYGNDNGPQEKHRGFFGTFKK
ncbi:MAG: lecithin retinol acyltransferase family protein [Clostridia bacterium]|nr:lecithin retinol acyltransferase family protein [Clostridia bacterium]